MHDSILAPSEPEIVACPGPVVNPLPYTPRDKTSKPTKTKKSKKDQRHVAKVFFFSDQAFLDDMYTQGERQFVIV